MTKVLNIISSPRGTESISIKVATAIIDKFKTQNENVTVTDRDLIKNPFPHLEIQEMVALRTRPENLTAEQKILLKKSDEAIAELFDAEVIIIGAPMYNFTISSNLKTYFDRILRAGITFNYAATGPEGLVKNKKAYIAAASDAPLTELYLQQYDFVTPYLKLVLGFIGITDVTVFRAEGFGIPELKETALPKAIATINEFSF